MNKNPLLKNKQISNKISLGLQIQQDYNIQLHCPQGPIGWAGLYNVYDKDKELKENLRKAPNL